MGWNTGYTIFEATVVGAYDLGKLDRALLAVLMEPYRDSDIDSGGSYGLRSADGKKVEHIVAETWGIPLPPVPNEEDHEAGDAYRDAVVEAFNTVTQHFGW